MNSAVEAAYRAGYEAACEHGEADPTACPSCRLTDAEVASLAILHRPHLAAATPAA